MSVTKELGIFDPNANALIGLLPKEEIAGLERPVKTIQLNAGDVLYKRGKAIKLALFPIAPAVVLVQLALGAKLPPPVGLVGREGMLGSSMLRGDEWPLASAVVLNSGPALAIEKADLLTQQSLRPNLRKALNHYSQASITQALVNAHCHHSHEAKLARWMLEFCDRTTSLTVIDTTHATIAASLALYRSNVSGAAAILEENGCIAFKRNRIAILNRPLLLATACSCYDIIRDEYDRLLPGTKRLLGARPPIPNKTAPRKGT